MRPWAPTLERCRDHEAALPWRMRPYTSRGRALRAHLRLDEVAIRGQEAQLEVAARVGQLGGVDRAVVELVAQREVGGGGRNCSSRSRTPQTHSRSASVPQLQAVERECALQAGVALGLLELARGSGAVAGAAGGLAEILAREHAVSAARRRYA